MGMFDDIRCHYPLPVEGANGLDYQTKDTPMQYLDQYEIREDGTLWHETYEIEDQSPRGKWLAENPGQPEPKWDILDWCGCGARVNKKWEQVTDFTGEVRFYTTLSKKHPYDGWIEWSAYFVKGALREMNLVEHRPANSPNAKGDSQSPAKKL